MAEEFNPIAEPAAAVAAQVDPAAEARLETARAFLDGGGPVAEKLPVKLGRRTLYTDEIADKICAAIASGKTMVEVEELPCFPGAPTIYEWLRKHADFRAAFEAAMEWRVERDMDTLMEIALDKSKDTKLKDDAKEGTVPKTVPDPTAIERSRLAVETMKWRIVKRLPRKYGDIQPLVIQQLPAAPPHQPVLNAPPGEHAILIGESSSVEASPFSSALRMFEQVTGRVGKVIAG